MIGFNRRFDPNFASLAPAHRRRRDRLARDRLHRLARSLPAASLLYRPVGRPLPGHDDPRFRHGALHPGRGAGRGQRDGLGAGRQGDRRGGRHRHRRRHHGNEVGQGRADLQLAARELRLRPARRGPWRQGHGACRQCSGDDGRIRRRARLHQRQGRSTSSSSATRVPIATNSTPSSTRSRPARSRVPTARTASGPIILADAAYQSWKTKQRVAVG